ncbi:hypothetical protein ES703_81122 [subsurface metagenome]
MITVLIKKGKAVGSEPGHPYSLQPWLAALLEITEISEGVIAFLPDEAKENKDRICSNCGSGRLHLFTAGPKKAPIIRLHCIACGAVQQEFRWTEQGSISHHLMLEVIAGSENLPR